MMRTMTLCGLMLLMTSCGSKSLDLGGLSGGGRDHGDHDNGTGDAGVADNDGGVDVGTQSTVLLPHQPMAGSLYRHGSYLYWTTTEPTASEIRRCQPRNCSQTLETVLRPASGIRFRGDYLYLSVPAGIATCPISGCNSPTLLVTTTAGGHRAAVDDFRIYWSSIYEATVYSCPVSGCAKPETAILTGVMTFLLDSDETHLYWTNPETLNTRGPYKIQSAPKDGSEAPKTLTRVLQKPASFGVHGGFVYWATMDPQGAIARCATSGCPDDGPEILASGQHYPQHPVVRDDQLFWLTETSDKPSETVARPAYVKTCKLANCANSVTVLDHAMGGSRIPAQDIILQMPALAVDDEAIYYIGDYTTGALSDGGVYPDSSIRRLMRKDAATSERSNDGAWLRER